MLGEASRVEQRAVDGIDVLMKVIDQHAFVIRLMDQQFNVQLSRQQLQPLVDLSQRRGAVDVRFAATEQIEVRSVQDQEFHLRMRASSSLTCSTA